jgi:hypothetical protein
MQQIAIKTSEGTLIVDAAVWGPLGVHQSHGDQFLPWSVTHVPTGLLIKRFKTQNEAVALVDRVRQEGLDMNFTDPIGMSRAARAALARLCERPRRPKDGLTINVTVSITMSIELIEDSASPQQEEP